MSNNMELQNKASEAFEEAYELLNSEEDWKEAKRNEHGDVVLTKKNKRGKNIYRVKAVIDVSAEKLIPALKDIPNSTKWNKTLTKCQVVSELSEDIKVTYQVTSEGGGGLVSARDFVLVVKQGYKGKDYLQAGCSIEHPDVPKDKKIVRAWNGPGGQLVREIPGESDKCEIYWLMDCEYNGWIMSSILTIAMPVAQLDFIECVRELAKTL